MSTKISTVPAVSVKSMDFKFPLKSDQAQSEPEMSTRHIVDRDNDEEHKEKDEEAKPDNDQMTDSNRSFTHYAPSVCTSEAYQTPSLSAVKPSITIGHLVYTEKRISQQQSRAAHGAFQLTDLIVKHNITLRLEKSLRLFYSQLVEKARTDPSRFSPAYQQSLEFIDSVLGSNYPINRSHFAFSLKPHEIQLINSFLCLVKSTPQFVVNCLQSMSPSDLNNMTKCPGEAFDDLTFLLRLRPLHILFYGLFPSDNDLKQRTEYFSTICANLLVNQRGENLCTAILDQFMQVSGNAYTPQLEKLILTFLQNGSFLTDNSSSLSASQQQTNSSPSTPTSESPSPDFLAASATQRTNNILPKASSTSLSSSLDETNDQRAASFLSQSVNMLLEFFSNKVIDSIPAKFITFVHCIISKIPQPHQRNCILFITVKYFFYKHLYNLIVCPELFGILKNYYINDLQRKKVLLPVFQKFYKTVIASVYYWNDDNSLENARLKQGIDCIMERFANFQIRSSTDVLPELCKPGEMIVVSPSDLVTLYAALFPSFTQQPKPSTSVYPISPRSNISQLARSVDSAAATTASLHSASASLPSFNETESSNFNEMDIDSSVKPSTLGSEEDFDWNIEDVQSDVKPAITALIKKFPYLQFKDSSYLYSLRPGKFQHFKIPHPAAENWQIFRVDDDGIFSPVNDNDILNVDDQHPNTSVQSTNTSLNSHRDSISATIGDIPDDEYMSSLFSIPGSRSLVAQVRTAIDNIVIDIANEDIYHIDIYSQESNHVSRVLDDSMKICLAKERYLDANEFSNALAAFSKITSSNRESAKAIQADINNHILYSLLRAKEATLSRVKSQYDFCESLTSLFTLSLSRVHENCDKILATIDNLRTKVWYTTEVRPSPMWTRARDIAFALSNNSNDVSNSLPKVSQPSLKRNNSSSSIASTSGFSFKRFTSSSSKRDYASRRQSLIGQFPTNSVGGGLFVNKDFGGDFKLVDKEADSTNRWLSEQNIQNFCIGEERIHRFHCELDDLVKRIMGDALTSRRNKGHSLLTSSVLFRHDLWKRILEIEGRNRSSTPSFFATRRSSVHCETEEELRHISENFENSRLRSNTDKNTTLRYHRVQKSSPNQVDMFSSFDFNKRGNDSREDLFGHRRNRSLNDSDVPNSDNGDPFGLEDGGSLDINEKRQELDELILEYQMTLVSFIYSDIGMTWFEGKYFYVGNVEFKILLKYRILTRFRD